MSGTFARLSAVEVELLQLMDGTRDEAQLAAAMALRGRFCPEPRVRAFAARAAAIGLLEGVPPPPRATTWPQRLFSLRVPLFDPTPCLGTPARVWRALCGPAFAAPWLLFVIGAACLVGREITGVLRNGLEQLTPANLPWLFATIFVVKLLHELGHAAAAHRHGAAVPQAGVVFLCLLPCLFVDTTAGWALSHRRQRLEIALAGILVELTIAATAAYVWFFTTPGVAHAIAFYLMTVSFTMSLLLNGNPLMRYDGYFVMTELVREPNLAGRAAAAVQHLFWNRWLGVAAVPAVGRSRREARWLAAYGFAATTWRVVLVLVMAQVVYARVFPALGIALAAIALWSFLLAPLWRTGRDLLRLRRLLRPRLLPGLLLVGAVTTALLAVALPLPGHRVYPCIVEATDVRVVAAPQEGLLAASTCAVGDRVVAGAVLCRLGTDDLDHEVAQARLGVQIAEQRLAVAEARVDEWQRTAVAVPELVAARDRLQEMQSRREEIVATAPCDGVLIRWDPRLDVGAPVQRGQELGRLARGDRLQARAFVGERDLDTIEVGTSVLLDVPLAPYTVRGRVVRVDRYAIDGLDGSPLSSRLGGSIATHGTAAHSDEVVEPCYEVVVALDDCRLPPGVTGALRVPGGRAPAVFQAFQAALRQFQRGVLL